jgi:predicted RNA-binding protein with PIN domain
MGHDDWGSTWTNKYTCQQLIERTTGMPYMIDGHNLIGALPDISLNDPDDETILISLLSRYFYRVQKQAVIYFDQRSPVSDQPRPRPKLSVVFIAKPRTADQAIQAHLKRLGKEAANWTVVSSDREVQEAAKLARANILSSQEFSRSLIQLDETLDVEEKPSKTLSEDELSAWLDLFNSRKD